jgi:tetratricopeptide (TPR) repeat protein
MGIQFADHGMTFMGSGLEGSHMDFAFKTTEINIGAAMSAYTLYKQSRYQEALPFLIEILNIEPKNWQARLFAGACYFKIGQPLAAERAIQFVYENTSDDVLKQKACFALQTIRSARQASRMSTPEFGELMHRTQLPVATIESIIT